MHDIWNPWHGCQMCSEGCQNCYMYFLDKQHGNGDSSVVTLNCGNRLICNGCSDCGRCANRIVTPAEIESTDKSNSGL